MPGQLQTKDIGDVKCLLRTIVIPSHVLKTKTVREKKMSTSWVRFLYRNLAWSTQIWLVTWWCNLPSAQSLVFIKNFLVTSFILFAIYQKLYAPQRRFFYYVFHIQWQKYLFENVDFFSIWCGKHFAISIGQIHSNQFIDL